MRLLEPLADPAAPLARRNPVAKLAGALLLAACCWPSVDPVTPALALAASSLLVPLAGIRYGALLRRGWPLLVGAAGVFVVTLLFTHRARRRTCCSRPGRSWSRPTALERRARVLSLRLVALALPGRARVRVDRPDRPGRRADPAPAGAGRGSRSARWRRCGWLPLLAAEWETLTLARRARGVDAGAQPGGAGCGCSRRRRSRCWSARSGGAPGWRRRWTRAASTPGVPRTVARPQHFGAADAALIVGALRRSARGARWRSAWRLGSVPATVV